MDKLQSGTLCTDDDILIELIFIYLDRPQPVHLDPAGRSLIVRFKRITYVKKKVQRKLNFLVRIQFLFERSSTIGSN